jgi:hypothetical protein
LITGNKATNNSVSSNPSILPPGSASSYDEKAVLSLVAAGDQTAFRQLYDRYRDRVYGFAYFLTRLEPMAEEISDGLTTSTQKVRPNTDRVFKRI